MSIIISSTVINIYLLILKYFKFNDLTVGKRVAIILSIVLISGLAVLTYTLNQGRKNLFNDPWKAISTNAAIIIESVDIQSFMNSLTTGKGIFGEIAKVSEIDKIHCRPTE
jgi:hypothetical protein